MRLKSLISPTNTIKAIFALIVTLGCFSCNSVIDDGTDHPCGLKVRFVYDYNMEYANSFHNKVDCVTLFVFDEQGNFVTTLEEKSDALKSENFRMHVDLLKGGKYTLLAYGGLACDKRSFDLHPLQTKAGTEGLKISDLSAEMHHNNFVQDKSLHGLYYGKAEVVMNDYDYQEKTVYMIKDTNNFRVVLQQMNGEVISDKEFECYITDDNSYLNYNNDVISKGTVTYLPWAQGQSIVDDSTWQDESLDQPGPVTAAYYELSTSRLIAHPAGINGLNPNARLVVKSVEKQREVINIPLIKYLMLYRSQLYESMDKQEFLDRESEWTMAFFLDSNNRWVNAYIIVNDWVVRINDAEL